MTKLEEKVRKQYQEYLDSHNGQKPKYAQVDMKWKDEHNIFVENCVALFEYDILIVPEEDDKETLFYFGSFENMLQSLIKTDDLEHLYDQPESIYQVGTEEFVIVDVLYFI